MGVFDFIGDVVKETANGGPGAGIAKALGGKNEYQARAYEPDRANFQYGDPQAADRYGNMALGAHSAGLGADADQARARGQQLDALSSQQNAMQLQQQAAMGNAPSRAQILGRQMADQAAATQQSLAASARGPAALALAQQNAAANTANAQTQIAGQAMAQRADEMANARNAYAQGAAMYQQGAGGIRAGDQAFGNAQRGYALGMTGAESNARSAQLDANQNYERLRAASANNAQGINAGIAGQNAQTNWNTSMGLIKQASDTFAGGSMAGGSEGLGGLVKSVGGLFMGSSEGSKSAAALGALAGSMGGGTAGVQVGQSGSVVGSGIAKAVSGSKESDGSKGKGENPYLRPGAYAPMGFVEAMPTFERTPTQSLMNAAQPLMASPEGSKAPVGSGIARAVQTASGKQFPAPSGGDMEQYLASTRGGLYAYKDPNMPGAAPGANYGPPSAEDMQRTGIGRVVTTTDPRTGTLAIDKDKALKASMSATSYVNDKLNALISQLGMHGGR